MFPQIIFASILALALTLRASAVTLFQTDDFSSGVSGWVEGPPSPNPPSVDDTGLPGGPFLKNVSTGGGGPGSRMVMWNDAQWTGDFIGEGIVAIEFEAISMGLVDFRFAFNGAGGWYYTEKIRIDDAGAVTGLVSYLLPITEADLAYASGGTGNYADTMADVTRMEIISASGAPTIGVTPFVLKGDAVNATLQVDNIRAIPEPGSVGLLLLAACALFTRRQRNDPMGR